MCVGEWFGNLVIVRTADVEIWEPDGSACIWSVFSKELFECHAVIEHNGLMVLCSSGLDLIYALGMDGAIKWKWHGGGMNPVYGTPEWTCAQISGYDSAPIKGNHLNSLFACKDGGILSSGLTYGEIFRLDVGGENAVKTQVHCIGEGVGLHSPVYIDGQLHWCMNGGVHNEQGPVMSGMDWPKWIKAIPGKRLVTHTMGVTVTDERWNTIETHALPNPFGIALLEE
jgi:hypothetical protein